MEGELGPRWLLTAPVGHQQGVLTVARDAVSKAVPLALQAVKPSTDLASL